MNFSFAMKHEQFLTILLNLKRSGIALHLIVLHRHGLDSS
jgi:hypothetical protein